MNSSDPLDIFICSFSRLLDLLFNGLVAGMAKVRQWVKGSEGGCGSVNSGAVYLNQFTSGSKTSPGCNLTETNFRRDAVELLEHWTPNIAGLPMTELRDRLQAAGFCPGEESSGARTNPMGCPGRYLSIAVHDPVLGNFVMRLWLLASWNTGLHLLMGAYPVESPGGAADSASNAEASALAAVSLANKPMNWASLSLVDAKLMLLEWQVASLAPGAAGSIGAHWPKLLDTLEGALAP